MRVQLGQNMNVRYKKTKTEPVSLFLTGKSHGQRSLAGYCAWGC